MTKTYSWRVISSAAVLAVIFLAIGMYSLGLFSPDPMGTSEKTRVEHAFHLMSIAVAQKEGVPSLELSPVRAGVASYPDGTKASLWVSDPMPLGTRPLCYYVDENIAGGASGYSDSACGVPGTDVILERQGAIVIGYIGLTPARTIFVTVNGSTTKLPITLGYFILPGALSTDPNAKFTITLMSKTGDSLGTVRDLMAPGSATPR